MDILKKRADWAQDVNDPRAAAEMYLNAGEITKAVEIIAANGWSSMYKFNNSLKKSYICALNLIVSF